MITVWLTLKVNNNTAASPTLKLIMRNRLYFF
jgi:hypothetical protein